jgi:hypothetical protein
LIQTGYPLQNNFRDAAAIASLKTDMSILSACPENVSKNSGKIDISFRASQEGEFRTGFSWLPANTNCQ